MTTPIEQLSDRELDRAVAEKVMEWHHEGGFYWLDQAGKLVAGLVWSPSTNMAAAWQVVEKLYPLRFSLLRGTGYGKNFSAEFWIEETGRRVGTSRPQTNPAGAICLAAVRAKGVTEVDDDTD